MDEALSEVAPETDSTAPASPGSALEDASAVDDGSATSTSPKTVEASRFNGLMASHQRVLADLEAERRARFAAEARLQEGTSIMPQGDDATLSEVQALRAELQEARLAQAKAETLARYPEAAPFADLIVGNTPSEIEAVAEAISVRTKALLENLGAASPETGAAETAATETTTTTTTTTDGVRTVPIVAGGEVVPGDPVDREALRKEAIQEGSWDKFWASMDRPTADLS